MPVTFKLTASIPVELDNPSANARSLVRALVTRNQSFDVLMSTFLSFSPELARSFYASEPYDTRKLLLAVAVLRKFYNPIALRPIYDPILIEHMALRRGREAGLPSSCGCYIALYVGRPPRARNWHSRVRSLTVLHAHGPDQDGSYMLTPYGAMPFLIRYISDWCAKSRRVASKVLFHVNAFRALGDIWNAMPKMPAQNSVTVSWHAFIGRFGATVQISPVTGKVVTPCMNRMCINAALGSRRKRCKRCKTFIVCSDMCFRAAHRAGLHKC
ncbi:hypothetical protein BDZ89DRAFT_614032 [Hymenopellis radicata]|nr:hypothetical protein BDZ89DRAFT_614032 [Hymenopellis radicata]